MEVLPVKHVQGHHALLGEYPRLAYAFSQVKDTVSRVFPELSDIKLFVGCPHQDQRHSHHQWKDTDRSGRNWRAFMHTGDFDKTICVHPHAETELPNRNLFGMFLHEFGHQINDLVGLPNTQKNADFVILKYFGLKIRYSSPGRIQYIDL